MFRVYLADDEQLIREGLAQTIPWETLGLTLVGQGADGQQAYREILEQKPEIVLTDIRMPYLDGLELISKVRTHLPDCRFVLITGFGEFEYARAAVRLGVSDFVLKPVDIPMLCATLTRLRTELEGMNSQKIEVDELRSRVQQADAFQLRKRLLRYMTSCIGTQVPEQLPETLRRANAISLVLLQIDQFDSLTASMGGELIFALTQTLENTLEQIRNGLQEVVLEEFGGRYLLLFFGEEAQKLQFEVNAYIRRLRMVSGNLKFTAVFSPAYPGISQCPDAYQFVCDNLPYAFQAGANCDVHPEAWEKKDAVSFPDIPNMGKVIRDISSFNKNVIQKDFDLLAEEIRQTGHNSYLYTHMLVSVVYGEILKMLMDIHCPIESIMENPTDAYKKILACSTLDDMLAQLFGFIAKICDHLENNTSANQNAAERAKVYIEEHYVDSGLTLNEVAGAIGISPNYFSALFKEATGSSFITFLTTVRLSHAKELLKTGTYKTYEVAAYCGYENSTYFSTIFKKYTGVSPSEYRDGSI